MHVLNFSFCSGFSTAESADLSQSKRELKINYEQEEELSGCTAAYLGSGGR